MSLFPRRLLLAAALALPALGPLAAPAAAEPRLVAIANFGEHPILAEAVQGFRDEILASGLVEGTDVVFSQDHVNFDATLVPQMIAKIEASNPALVLTVTTPVSQNFKSQMGGKGVPLVFLAVTDPVAGGLVPAPDQADPAMTGASDALNIDGVFAFTRQLFPDARVFGIPFNPSEANDVSTVAQFKARAAEHGFEVVEVGVDNANDIQPRVAGLAAKVDVIYAPGSSLIQPALAAVAAAANEAGVPLINNNTNMVDTGDIAAAAGVSYDRHGHLAGRLAVRLLAGEDPATVAPAYPGPEDQAIMISRRAMAALGKPIPDSFADCDCIVD